MTREGLIAIVVASAILWALIFAVIALLLWFL